MCSLGRAADGPQRATFAYAHIALLLTRFCRIKSWTFSATARFSAAACTSSCRPCFFRKFSKLLPRCLFLLLAVFDVCIFASQSQSSVFVWSFLRFLGEAVQKNGFPLMHKIESARSLLAMCCEFRCRRSPEANAADCSGSDCNRIQRSGVMNFVSREWPNLIG